MRGRAQEFEGGGGRNLKPSPKSSEEQKKADVQFSAQSQVKNKKSRTPPPLLDSPLVSSLLVRLHEGFLIVFSFYFFDDDKLTA